MKNFKNSNLILGALAVSTVSTGIVANASNEHKLFKSEIKITKNNDKKYAINWENTIGADKEDKFYDVIQLKDGGFVAIGQSALTATTGFTTGDAIIVKFDSDGNEVWRDIVNGDETEKYYSAVELSDGSIIALGISYSTDLGFTNTSRTGNAIITKYTADGNQEWLKNFSNGNNPITFKNVVPLSDGNLLVVCGEIDANLGGGILEKDSITTNSILKISNDGDIVWEKEYTDTNNKVVISDIKKSSDGNIILTGYTYKSNNKDNNKLIVAKLDEDLNEIWSTVNDYFDSVKCSSITEGADGEIYVAGEVSDDTLDGTEGYLSRFDAKTGDFEWESILVGENDDSFNSVSVNSKGELVVIGHSNSPLENTTISDKTEVIMVKFGVDGHEADIISLGKDTQGLVVSSSFIDKNDNVIIVGKQGKNVGDVPCDLINPCLQYDAMLLSVKENLDSPIYCTSNMPTLIGEDISIKPGQMINPLDYISIKEEDLKYLEDNITFTTNLEGSDTEYTSNKTGEYYIEYGLHNDCGDVTSLRIKVNVKDDVCSINPPVITGPDTVTYIIGDDFNVFDLIKVENIDTTKVAESKTDNLDGKAIGTIIYESGDKIVAISDIDFSKVGTYNVNFTVSNSCGESTKDVKVIVKEKDNSSVNTDSTTDKPQTGDNILSYIGIGALAIGGLAIVNRKNKKNEESDTNNESNNN